jgi:hypothetical protein
MFLIPIAYLTEITQKHSENYSQLAPVCKTPAVVSPVQLLHYGFWVQFEFLFSHVSITRVKRNF